MTDKELIQALRYCHSGVCADCPAYENPDCTWMVTYGGAADRLEALLAENERLTIELQAMRNAANGYKKLVPKWVSVEERLPEYVGDYLVVLDGTREMAVLFYDKWPPSWTDDDDEEYTVTHWMPAPCKPEGVE